MKQVLETARLRLREMGMDDLDGIQEPALSYIIHRPFWRRGFATEAAAASRDHVAEKIGMQLEGRTVHADLVHLAFSQTRHD